MKSQTRTNNSWQSMKAIIATILLTFGMFPGTLLAQSSGQNEVELHGAISKLPGTANFQGDWTVGGKIIKVGSATVIRQNDGAVAVGAYVEVKGTMNSDGSIAATRVSVDISAAGGGDEAKVSGNIEELPSTTGRIGDWKVAGKVVHVLATTVIKQEDGPVAVGIAVEVEGVGLSDGSINALKIETRNGISGETKLLGKVEQLPSTANRVGDWKVSGRLIHVSASTLLRPDDGPFFIGGLVKVEGNLLPDGSLNATEIETKSDPQTQAREVEFRGTVEAIPATANLIGDWRISGRIVHVTAQTILISQYGPARVGSIVEVEGWQKTDNSVDAKKVEVESQPAAVIRSNQGYCRFYGVIKALPATTGWIGEWNVGGHKLNVVAATTINQEKGAVAIGALAEVLATITSTGLQAFSIEIKGVSASAGYVKFFGTVSALPATTNLIGAWTVGGKVVHVTASTRINQEKGKVIVGSFLEVEGNRRTDGSTDATSIEVKTDASTTNDNTGFISFYDTIKALPTSADLVGDWTVGTKTIHVSKTTVIDIERGQATVGALVEVKGNQKTDGTIDATKIEVKGTVAGGAGQTFIEIVGAITALPTTQNLVGDWKIDGRTIRVTATTFIKREHGAPAVGVLVEAKGQLQADGSIDATVIEVKRASNFTTLNRLTSVNGAGYQSESSVEGIIASFGSGLSSVTLAATSLPLPVSLGGVSVLVDGKPAQLFFVSPNQINYQVPAGSALGTAKVEVVNAGKTVAQGTIVLPGVAPSLFTATSDGKGLPAGYITRVKSDFSQSNEAILRYDDSLKKFVATPIIRKSGDALYLVLFGTGFRAAPDSDGNKSNGVAENVEVTIGGVKAQVAYAGASSFVGVEQLNILLPDNVSSGSSLVVLIKVYDGQGSLVRSNQVMIAIQ